MNPQQDNQNMAMNQQNGAQMGGTSVPQAQQYVQPQVAMPGQAQPMPVQPMPGQSVPGQPVPGQAQPMPGQPQVMMPTQPMPGQPQVMMPGQDPAMVQAQQEQAKNRGRDAKAANIGATAIEASRKPQPTAKRDDPTSTQSTLLISELRDNVVIMKDGSFRAVVACKSINFDLMSEMEREGVEYSYQNFLNSLKFTTQFLIRSQRVDIGPYLEKLSEIRRNNDNLLLGVLMDDYINFVDILSQEANIMDKSFFIVIPYYTSAEMEKSLEQTKNFFKTFSKSKAPVVTRIDRATYDKALTELTNRVDTVMSGLFQIGVHSVRLNTKELAELYYNFNNPDTAVREPLVDFSKLATMYVRKGEGERPKE